MRDRLLTLGLRRPTRIYEKDFDLPMLEEDDFDIGVIDRYHSGILPNCELIRNVEMQRDLALLCIAKVKLLVCTGHILDAQYAMKPRETLKPGRTAVESTMMIFPTKALEAEEINRADEELKEWSNSLPSCCQTRPLQASDKRDGYASIAVQRALLHMTYGATILALHRCRFLPNLPAKASSSSPAEVSTHKAREAAMRITQTAADLLEWNLEKFLPASGITAFLPSAIVYLQQMRHSDPEVRSNAIHSFRVCREVIEKMRVLYVTGDFAALLLDAGLRKFGLHDLVNGSETGKGVIETASGMPTPEDSLSNLRCESDSMEEGMEVDKPEATLANPGHISVMDIFSPPPVDFVVGDTGLLEVGNHQPDDDFGVLNLCNMDLAMLGELTELDSNALFHQTAGTEEWWTESGSK